MHIYIIVKFKKAYAWMYSLWDSLLPYHFHPWITKRQEKRFLHKETDIKLYVTVMIFKDSSFPTTVVDNYNTFAKA